MPTKTNTDRIIELEKIGVRVIQRLDHGDGRTEAIILEHKESLRILTELRLQYEREVGRLKHEIEELTKANDDQKAKQVEWNRRAWACGPNVVAAIISVVCAPIGVWLWTKFF